MFRGRINIGSLHFPSFLQHKVFPGFGLGLYGGDVYNGCMLTYCILAWHLNCTLAEKTSLQKIINAAQRVVGCRLASLNKIYKSCCVNRAGKKVSDPSYPENYLFELLPSGRRFRNIKVRTNRFKESLFPKAIKALNGIFEK